MKSKTYSNRSAHSAGPGKITRVCGMRIGPKVVAKKRGKQMPPLIEKLYFFGDLHFGRILEGFWKDFETIEHHFGGTWLQLGPQNRFKTFPNPTQTASKSNSRSYCYHQLTSKQASPKYVVEIGAKLASTWRPKPSQMTLETWKVRCQKSACFWYRFCHRSDLVFESFFANFWDEKYVKIAKTWF